MTGTFFAVVGPSGAGKDTLIARARELLEPTGHYVFPARYVTRPADAGGEDHMAVTSRQFAAMHADGGFALSWRALGLSYGIPVDVERQLDEGRNVVANLSRTAVDAARRRFASVRIIVVSASEAVIAGRLAARGREDAAGIAGRLKRAGLANPIGGDVDVIVNDGELDAVAESFTALLERRADQGRSARS